MTEAALGVRATLPSSDTTVHVHRGHRRCTVALVGSETPARSPAVGVVIFAVALAILVLWSV